MIRYTGYAFRSDSKEKLEELAAAAKRVSSEDITELIKQPKYGRVDFFGTLSKEARVEELDLLAYASGNLCFGGELEITGRKFKGSYNTD